MMASLVSLQLMRVAGAGDYHASACSISIRCSKAVISSRLFQGSGLRITSYPGEGSLQGGGTLCCPLWSHLLISKTNLRVLSTRAPIRAFSIGSIPVEDIKQIAILFVNISAFILKRTTDVLRLCPPLVAQVTPAVALVAYSIWGLGPTTRLLRKNVFERNDKKWDESRTHNILSSYMRPILLWIGIILICRAFDPVVLATEASQAIKQRFVNFIRSLSTVLAFAFCTASLIKQVQRFMMENQDAEESRNVGVQFIGNTVYTAVWVAAVCLFMELLGFSTQKWITAGGFGTVLITLAGREIFTNFLSSIMIHATRPFVENEWIQTKIEGQEVSGTVEYVGWWSPTVIRGDDREAVHIPNHKFSVSVVRNLSQKTHWRIKMHLGISHLDVSKLAPIVTDMRKVLAKHPQVEQHRLHRRVFFDQIDPENQALMILVSCFVKTSHFEEYLRVKEVIILDLLKVIGHHSARLATPIRSVQRVIDESEARSSPFRDMRNTNQNQRRPFLLVNPQAASSDDDEGDSDSSDDVLENTSRISRATKIVRNKDSADSGSESESDEPVEDQSVSKTASDIKELKANAPVIDENVNSSSPRIPVASQHNVKGPNSDESHPQESASTEDTEPDVNETLMDRIYAGTEETLVRSHTDTSLPQKQNVNAKSSVEQAVAASAALVRERVVEMPEEKVPHLYSNNVGLDDVKDGAVVTTSPTRSDDHANDAKTTAPSVKINLNVHSDLTDDPWRQPPTSQLNESNHTSSIANDEIWPSDSEDQRRQASAMEVGKKGESLTNSDDLWKQPSTSQMHLPPKVQPSRATLDPNVVPGVSIKSPKHTISSDEDITNLDDLQTLVTLGKPKSSHEQRESSNHGVAKGGVSSDVRDKER